MLLRTALVFIVGAILFTAESAVQGKEIFRTINIKDGNTTFSLGESFSKVSDFFERRQDHYELKKGLFGGADRITVKIGKENRISSIFFDYSEKKDFRIAKVSYIESLGSSFKESKLEAGSIQVEVIYWEDANTRFELIKKTERGKESVSSALFDRK